MSKHIFILLQLLYSIQRSQLHFLVFISNVNLTPQLRSHTCVRRSRFKVEIKRVFIKHRMIFQYR